MLLQVGFKSLSYEMQKQEAAYDSNSLFGMRSDFAREFSAKTDFYIKTLSLHLFSIHLCFN